MSSIYLLQLVLFFFVMTLTAQCLGKLFNMPVLIFLLAEGIIAGPEVLKIFDPAVLGDGLMAIVSLCVAIIVFDGGLHIDVRAIRSIQKGVLRLVTLGVLITFVLATSISYAIVGIPLGVAAAFGALVTATGPTVITPVVRQIRVNHRVSKLLELEGVLNDAVSVILAALVFEFIISGISGFEVVGFILHRAFLGMLLGSLSGLLLTRFLSSGVFSEQMVRIITFTMVITTFVIAETFGNESGILAVALFGIILGSSKVPYKAALKEFKGDLVVVMLSLIFILLAAMLRFEDIIRIGLLGVGVVLTLIFLVRPLCVFICTRGTRFSVNEKLFISFVGPRGVVPASIATYFAIKLNDMGLGGGQELVGLVFLTVIITVLMTGILSKYVAKLLKVIPMEILLIGGGEVGRILAERFEKRGENVVIVESSEEKCQRLMKSGYRVIHGDAEDVNVLKSAGVENAKYVVATTDKDNTNLLVSQIAKSKFGFKEDRIVARVNNMENLHAFWDLEIRAMSPAMSTAIFLDNMVGRPSMFTMCEAGENGDILEVKVTNPKVVGKAVKDLTLPENSLLLMVCKGDRSIIANGNVKLDFDDIVTVIGEGSSARVAADMLGK